MSDKLLDRLLDGNYVGLPVNHNDITPRTLSDALIDFSSGYCYI